MDTVKDRIQTAVYIKYTVDTGNGNKEDRWLTELGVIEGTNISPESLVVVANTKHKVPVDAPTIQALFYLERTVRLTEDQIAVLIKSAMNSKGKDLVTSVTITYEEALFISFDDTPQSAAVNEYALMFSLKRKDRQAAIFILCGGVYGSLELIETDDVPKKFHNQAFRFSEVPNIQEIITDNLMISSMSTSPTAYITIPAPELRNPANWNVVKLVTFSAIEKVYPYVQKFQSKSQTL